MNKKYHNPQRKKRRSIRLKGYDYSQPGLYFITLCSKNREHLFGKIENRKILLNSFGNIVVAEWLKTTGIRENINLDSYIVMPNHIHGIIHIVESDVRAYGDTPQRKETSLQSPAKTIGAIIRGFKSAVTKQINEIRQTPDASVWQRNYWACPDAYRGTYYTR